MSYSSRNSQRSRIDTPDDLNIQSHHHDVRNRLFERDVYFGMDSSRDNMRERSHKDRIEQGYNRFLPPGAGYGEITGITYGNTELDQGMPMREAISDHPSNRYDDEQYTTDFGLYEDKPNTNVMYYDPTMAQTGYNGAGLMADVREFNSGILNTTEVNPVAGITDTVNTMRGVITKYLRQKSRDPHALINTGEIVYILVGLGLVSNDKTAEELYELVPGGGDTMKRIFNHLHATVHQMYPGTDNKLLCRHSCILWIPRHIKISNPYAGMLERAGFQLEVYDPQHGKQNISKINNIIKAQTGEENLFKYDPSINTSISIFSSTRIFINLRYPFLKKDLVQGIFEFGDRREKMRMMSAKHLPIRYYESNRHKLIEMELTGGGMFGIILSSERHEMNEEELREHINRLSEFEVGYFQIPMINHRSQYKLNKMLYYLGFKSLFTDIGINNLCETTHGMHITNFVVSSSLVLTYREKLIKKPVYAIMKNITTLSINTPFKYYIRDSKSNMIFMTGRYA